MAGVNETVAETVRSTLASKEIAEREDSASDKLRNGRFDRTGLYSRVTEVDAWDFHSDWFDFETILKTQARHFSRTAENVLWDIFGEIEECGH
jgi:hypothetical protein